MEKEIQDNLNFHLNHTISCDCGHIHKTDLKEIEISVGAHQKLPSLLEKYGYDKIFLLADKNTYQAAGKEVLEILKEHSYEVNSYIFEDVSLVPDETALGKLFAAINPETQLVISVGTGTLNDLGKYLSYKFKLPFFIVATAPSMDGFASNVSCLILNHMKTTFSTQVPQAIIADLTVLANAPLKMIAAGVGDILGKYICLLDWKLSSIITSEYHCSYVESLVQKSIKVVTENIDKIKIRDIQAIHSIMEGLILSGVAMSYIGNSRPASGSEHHLSHFWELNFLMEQKPAVLHGIKVGIGTVAASRLYELLLNDTKSLKTPDFSMAKKHIEDFSYSLWVSQMQQYYKKGAKEVIQLEETVHKNGKKEVLERIDFIREHWEKIRSTIVEYLPGTKQLIFFLKQAGAKTEPMEESISRTLVYNSVLFAKELRNRYGLLQLLFDLGLNENFAAQLAENLPEESSIADDLSSKLCISEIINRR